MYTNTTFNAEAAGAFGVDTYRIWVPSCAQAYPNEDGSYRLVFDNSKLDILKDFVAKLKAQGVTHIVAKPTSHIIARDYAKYVGADGKLYTTEEAEAESKKGTSGVTMVYLDYYAVPDSTTESDAYAAFLEIQKMYFQQLSEKIPEITHFETINEPDGGASVRRTGRYCGATEWTSRGLTMPDSWTQPASYTTEEVAKICMDYNAAAMKGVRAADNGAKVLAPALTATDQGPELLQAFYSYIVSQTDHDPNNYFDYLNWHPYVFLTQDGDGRVAANSDDWYGWYDKWVTWQKNMHAIAEKAGDAGRKVWFTEMGVTDCGEVVYSSTSTGSQPITQTMAAERFAKMCELAETELSFVDTIVAFRLTDTTVAFHYTDTFYEPRYEKAYEGNFGMFEYFENEENSADCLKEIAKTYYGILNYGSTDYTRLYKLLERYFTAYKNK